MQAQSTPGSEDYSERVWFFPQKFWQATKDMSADQASELMAEVERYAEAHDTQALRKYPFVTVGNPYKKDKNGKSAA